MTSSAEIAQRRYSCRRYLDRPLEDQHRRPLIDILGSSTLGPFGNRCRFTLLAATPEDGDALKGLGTYGFIRGAAGFIVGALTPAPKDMEDYGYCLEQAVLRATGLGLGTCWLGGTFTKSSFARKISLRSDEVIPAVVALGYPRESSKDHWIRRSARGSQRRPHDRLFFDRQPGTPLDLPSAGAYAEVLEAVRWAPSASNKQPWRLVRSGNDWHFYLERDSDPHKKGMVHAIIKIADVQRVDMGIAMCHFDLVARELGIAGRWTVQPPPTSAAKGWEYIASWTAE